MRFRLLLLVIGGTALLGSVPSSQAGTDTRTGRLVVRVNVIRSCSVETRSSAAEGAVLVTCSRAGSEPGVVSTVAGAGLPSRVVPVPARQTTVVATPAAARRAGNGADATAATTGPATRQVVVLNF
jgi:hypothetical protein